MTQAAPTISIVIPCYNARRWIGEAVASALQPCAGPVEIIVIDDGSTDGSGELVRQQFPPARVVTTPNRGVSQARNLGIELARGDALVFLDADDLLAPGKLDRQLRLLCEAGADVAYSNWQRLRPGPDGAFCPAETVERSMEGDPEIALFTTFWCPTGAYLFRREIVDRVGGFSPRLPVIQDARFALDCALHAARFVHDAHVSCLYRTHDEDSVSTRSRPAFLRDCLTSAHEVQTWWEAHGGLTAPRRQALLQVLDGVARAACGFDDACFARACDQWAEAGGPAGPPPGRLPNRMLIRLLGYQRAHLVRAQLRRFLRKVPDHRDSTSARE